MARSSGRMLLAVVVSLAFAAPFLAPHDPWQQFNQFLNAPPTPVSLHAPEGGWRWPSYRPAIRVSQLEQRYRPSDVAVPLIWFRAGRLVQEPVDARAPFLLLGADSQGRDVFSRLLFGARLSLALAGAAALLALVVGAVVGGIAGYRGGVIDESLMRGSDILLVLPGMYVALVLRTLLPPVLPVWQVFSLLVVIFAVMGFPVVARGVRGVVLAERQRDYAVAARALGATPMHIVARHLVPATMPFLATQLTVLVPAFIVAEATFSYVGLGFPDPESTWGTMLHEAGNVRALVDFPWLLAPIAAMFAVVLGLHLVGREAASSPEQSLPL